MQSVFDRSASACTSTTRRTKFRSTTVLCVRRNGKVALAADGQVTMGAQVVKSRARKARRLHNEEILAGFAGSTADAISLFTRFEEKLQSFGGNLSRAAVELSKEWRLDKSLRHLEALLVVADAKLTLVLSGTGDVIEPDESVAAVGSGGPYAVAAATALLQHTSMGARAVAEEAMRIAASICIYTNSNITIEELG